MLSCKDVSRLMSDSLEKQLPLSKRMGIRMHLMMCSVCRTARKQLLFVRQLLTGYDRWLEESGPEKDRLPADVAERIKNEMAEHAAKPSENNSGNGL